jgi:hypothetical protein
MLKSEPYELFHRCQKKNVLIYAPGGGLGHFTRSLAISTALRFSNVTLLVSSIPESVSFQSDTDIQKIPQSAQNDISEFRVWFTKVLLTCNPDIILIDTFPAGIKGELNEVDLSTIHVVLIGRNLKIDVYKRNVEKIRNRINQIYLIEKVHDDYLDYLNNLCSDISGLNIDDPFDKIEQDPVFITTINKCSGEKWLLVHSGTQDECEKLCDYAQKIAQMHRVKPFLFLCGNFRPSLECSMQIPFNMYPVCQYYSLFDRVITGAGYNSVRQVKKYAHTYNLYPFERLYDDQYARIRQCDATKKMHIVMSTGV